MKAIIIAIALFLSGCAGLAPMEGTMELRRNPDQKRREIWVYLGGDWYLLQRYNDFWRDMQALGYEHPKSQAKPPRFIGAER